MTGVAMATEALLGTYARPDLVLVRGRGARVYDDGGTEYLDFTSGIGVNALGHGAPVVVAAIQRALEAGLIHTSNLFHTEPAERLAQTLVSLAFPSRVFFANSGAESVEAALKFARRYAGTVGGPDKHRVLAFHRSFHGRLFGTLAVTDRPAYREPFEPVMPGADFAHVGDLEAVARLISAERTAAVIIEPVQGEGGVHPVPAPFLEALRDLCDERRVALIFDEVQCGLGRTGSVFAYQQSTVTPDLLALAKPLGGGLPMGAVLVGEELASTIRPGDHATTFGGGPLVATVAQAVVETVSSPEFLAGVRERGEIVADWAGELAAGGSVAGVRGRGLMWGLELGRPVAPVIESARGLGVLAVGAGPEVLRILPPLNIEIDELEQGLGVLGRAIG